MQIAEITPSEVPMELLLLADPLEEAIKRYLHQSRCFAAHDKGSIVGACVIKPIYEGALELMNIAVSPSVQQHGVGTSCLGMLSKK